MANCDLCHNIKHIGLVNVKISEGTLSKSYYETLANHFMKVNNVSREEFEKHLSSAYALWEEKSKRKWRLIWNILSSL